MSSAATQMMRISLRSAKGSHIARSHLFLASRAGLARGRFWPEAMAADVLVYDFQDGCPPGEDMHVLESLRRSRQVFPGAVCSVRVKELACEDTGASQEARVRDQIRASLAEPQVRFLMLPMCNESADVQRYVDIINDVDATWLDEHGQLQLICETPWCKENLGDILSRHQDIAAVVVGGGDYSRYAQMSLASMTDLLRWEVLNACLRHGRFPIDSPTLGITANSAAHFEQGRKAGLRASLVLHPSLVEHCNATFSPSIGEVARTRRAVERWMTCGVTGYRRNSGEDFVGPPHLKQMVWESRYAARIRAKPAHFAQFAHVLPALKEALRPAPRSISLTDALLPFLALGAATHPSHRRLVANLGSAECRWQREALDDNGNLRPKLLNVAASVRTTAMHRRATSAGNIIVVSQVEILDEKHAPLFSYLRKFLEEPEPHDHDDRWAGRGTDKLARVTPANAVARTGAVIRETIVTAPGTVAHRRFCALLGYDAPLHHTESPTIASALHLACHRIHSAAGSVSETPLLHVSDITYHAPLTPSRRCKSTIYNDIDGNENSYISILRAIDDDDNESQIMSTVFFCTDASLLCAHDP